MVVVEYQYEEMKKLVNLPLDRMVDGLNNLGAPSEYQEETKKIMTELTPNRPDWYSMEGLARSLKAYYLDQHQQYKVKKAEKNFDVFVDASVNKIRPYTVCAIVKKLKFTDQKIRDIILLQEKLTGAMGRKVKKFGIGFYPLDAIKLPIHYKAIPPKEIKYRPLGFDKEITADEVLKSHKKGQQYGHILKGLDKYPAFFDSEGKVLSLIPIVNSDETGRVDESTEAVFIEVSGVEYSACENALKIIVCTLADMGGEVYSVKVHYQDQIVSTPDLTYKKMRFKLKDASDLIGIEIKEKEAEKLLAKMDYKYSKGVVVIPPYRADIIHEVDVFEDIAIAYGYNNLIPTLPDFFSAGQKIEGYGKYHNTMRGMGFLETRTFVLTNKSKLDQVEYSGAVTEIINPATEDYTIIRPIITQSILETMANNKTRGLPVKVYEIGNTYQDNQDKKVFVFGIMDKKLEFSDIRGYLQTLMRETNQTFELSTKQNKLFDDQISCLIKIDGVERGMFGKIKKEVLNKFGIEFEIYIGEIWLE